MKQVAPQRKAIGQRLVEEGLISREQLEIALREQKRTGEQLGRILQSLGFVSEDSLCASLSDELGVPRVSLSDYHFDPALMELVPAKLAEEHQLIALSVEDGVLSVAMADPCDIVAVDAVRKHTGRTVKVLAASPREIRVALDRYYADPEKKDSQLEEAIQEAKRGAGLQSPEEAAGQAPIIELVDQLVVKALDDRATDVHIEPEEKLVRTRYRVDGILHQGPSIHKSLQAGLVSRIKIQAELDISERRTPQDGRIRFRSNDSEVDLRVSVYPTAHGENVVLRVLDKSSLNLKLETLGFDRTVVGTLRKMSDQPHGMLLVTGPTGSGKTTTLYSLLAAINSLEKNVVTVEDPIEYQLPMIRQSQVNPKIGLTFAAGLRAILRQDPDVIMVGEVRDLETARIAVSAALTGHFVFTTLHTNTAAGALPRLMDMGIEPFLLSSAVSGVLAQRLARTICAECRQAYEASDAEGEQLGCPRGTRLFRGTGCQNCRGTGYRGRTVIYELLVMSDAIRKLTLARASETELAAAGEGDGMKTMQASGREKVLAGVTTLEEVTRVCRTAL